MKAPQRSLKKWTKQNWRTKSGKPSAKTGERYLPEKAIKSLSSAEYAATSAAKRKGTAKGKQFVKQPEKIADKVKKFRAAEGGLTMKNKKKEPTKLKKTAAGAQQYVDEKNFKKTRAYIGKDFLNLSAEAFKKKYGADQYKLFRSLAAANFAKMADDVTAESAKSMAKAAEKKYNEKAKRKGYNKGGMTAPKFKTCPGCPTPAACTAAGKCAKEGKGYNKGGLTKSTGKLNTNIRTCSGK